MAIVVSVLAPDLAELARGAERAAEHADVVELRLDALRGANAAELAPAVRAARKPVIAAVHGREGFGAFDGSPAERAQLLCAAAEAGAAFVDVDARFAGEFDALPAGVRRIVSHHEQDGTPADVDVLFARVDAAARPEDLVKVVTHARCAEDGLRVLAALARSTRERVAFCSGAKGAFTRVLATACGSRFTFASLPGASATAPGQLAADVFARATAHASNSARTRFFAVLGSPIAHSWSPRVHTAVCAARGADALYVACEPDDVVAFVALARELRFDGFSVTAPFKERVLDAATERSAEVVALGAANTLVRTRTGWSAHNTDALAIEGALTRAGAELAGARALVLGGGGAARAAAYVLAHAGARRITVAVRDPARVTWTSAIANCRAVPWDSAGDVEHDVLVHCTPLGSRAAPDAPAVPRAWFRAGSVVLDATYLPRDTEFLRTARACGARTASGAEWFGRQAGVQAVLFAGEPTAPVIERMRAALILELEHAYVEEDASAAKELS